MKTALAASRSGSAGFTVEMSNKKSTTSSTQDVFWVKDMMNVVAVIGYDKAIFVINYNIMKFLRDNPVQIVVKYEVAIS